MSFEDILSMIDVDQVGIHSARFGALSVRAFFKPVYCSDGTDLHLTMLVGEARVQLSAPGGKAADFHSSLNELARAGDLGRALIALNRANTGLGGLSLVLPACSQDEIESGVLAAVLDAEDELAAHDGFQPAKLICELPSPDTTCLADIGRYAAACRRRGLGVALGRFNGTQAAIEAARAVCPQIVSIDAGWFNRVTRSDQAARLLKPLFRSMRAIGARVHVGGLNTPIQVTAAYDAGADLYSGRALAASMPAGAFLKPSSVPLSTYTGRAYNVVQLFG